MQTTSDTIREGKNLGKSNETSAKQQAWLEAVARHEKQLKKGYVRSVGGAQAGEIDELVEGGVLPMLAKVWEDCAAKVKFPVAVQPKLNGHRCVAVVKAWFDADANHHAKVTLWSRTRKPITSMGHLVDEVVGIVCDADFVGDLVLDGELYHHDLRDEFEKITSLIRPPEARAGADQVEYHVYDMVSDKPYMERFAELDRLLAAGDKVKLVETHKADDEVALLGLFRAFRSMGYEGAMARQLHLPYEHKRSAQLLKLKEFRDAEFRVVRLEEGRGRLQGHT